MFKGAWAGGLENPGHGLGLADVSTIRSKMTGLPITVEHEGLLECIDEIQSSSDPAKTFSERSKTFKGAARPVGNVVGVGSSDGVFFSIYPDYSGIERLLDLGLLRGLSLTHAENTLGEKVPLELTLTNDPLRTSAYVSDRYLPKQFEREIYRPPAMETEGSAPVVEKTPLELALESMDEATRELFKGRFSELMAKIESLETSSAERNAATQQLEKELEEAKSSAAKFQESNESSTTMQRILEGQVRQLLEAQLPDSSNPDLSSLENEQVMSLIKENNPTSTQEALRQVVMACSRRVGARLTSQRKVAAAPVKAAEPVVTEEPTSKRSRGEAQEFDLSRALQSKFH